MTQAGHAAVSAIAVQSDGKANITSLQGAVRQQGSAGAATGQYMQSKTAVHPDMMIFHVF